MSAASADGLFSCRFSTLVVSLANGCLVSTVALPAKKALRFLAAVFGVHVNGTAVFSADWSCLCAMENGLLAAAQLGRDAWWVDEGEAACNASSKPVQFFGWWDLVLWSSTVFSMSNAEEVCCSVRCRWNVLAWLSLACDVGWLSSFLVSSQVARTKTKNGYPCKQNSCHTCTSHCVTTSTSIARKPCPLSVSV